jgi:hypothetical protein
MQRHHFSFPALTATFLLGACRTDSVERTTERSADAVKDTTEHRVDPARTPAPSAVPEPLAEQGKAAPASATPASAAPATEVKKLSGACVEAKNACIAVVSAGSPSMTGRCCTCANGKSGSLRRSTWNPNTYICG